jgi:hypothetical protein
MAGIQAQLSGLIDAVLQSAAKAIEDADTRTFIYRFHDYDPSRIWITTQIGKGLWHHAPDAEIFDRFAVTPEQMAAWSLPTRPTKREGSTHAHRFVGDSVELDAITAPQMRTLVRDCIALHVDRHQLAILGAAEQSERALLLRWAKRIGERPA